MDAKNYIKIIKYTKPELRFTKNRLQRSVGCAVTGKWLHRWFSAQPNLFLQKIIIEEHDCECNLTDFCAFTISFARLIDQLFCGILVDSQKTRLRTTDARARTRPIFQSHFPQKRGFVRKNFILHFRRVLSRRIGFLYRDDVLNYVAYLV